MTEIIDIWLLHYENCCIICLISSICPADKGPNSIAFAFSSTCRTVLKPGIGIVLPLSAHIQPRVIPPFPSFWLYAGYKNVKAMFYLLIDPFIGVEPHPHWKTNHHIIKANGYAASVQWFDFFFFEYRFEWSDAICR